MAMPFVNQDQSRPLCCPPTEWLQEIRLTNARFPSAAGRTDVCVRLRGGHLPSQICKRLLGAALHAPPMWIRKAVGLRRNACTLAAQLRGAYSGKSSCTVEAFPAGG